MEYLTISVAISVSRIADSADVVLTAGQVTGTMSTYKQSQLTQSKANVIIGSMTTGSVNTWSTINTDTNTYNSATLTSNMATKIMNTFMRLDAGNANSVATAQAFNSLNV